MYKIITKFLLCECCIKVFFSAQIMSNNQPCLHTNRNMMGKVKSTINYFLQTILGRSLRNLGLPHWLLASYKSVNYTLPVTIEFN